MSQENVEIVRRAVEPYVRQEELEAAGAFERGRGWGSDIEVIVSPFVRIYEYFGGQGRVGRLPTSFLLAVTRNKVHAFAYRQRGSNLVIRKQLAIFDRDEIAFWGYGEGSLHLRETEGGRTYDVPIDDRRLEPGAADVLAALRANAPR